jgi:hypothetical protein
MGFSGFIATSAPGGNSGATTYEGTIWVVCYIRTSSALRDSRGQIS